MVPTHTHCPHMCNQSIFKVFLQFPNLSLITVDSDCSHEITRCLLCGRKAMTNSDSILKSRDITLQRKFYIVKSMVFPVVMYRCETWTIKKAEHQRIDAFELWCWRRLLRVPWTARSNQLVLKEINPEYSVEGLMLKLQYFGHLMWRADSLEKSDAWEDWGQEEKAVTEDETVGGHHQLNGYEFEQTLGNSEGQGNLAFYSPQGCKESDLTEHLNTTTFKP